MPEPDQLLQDFLEGDLPEAESRAALHAIADDAEARALLRFELREMRDWATSRPPSVPTGFADRTLSALPGPETTSADAPEASRSLGDRLVAWWHTLIAPRRIALRPVYALVLMVGVGTGWLVAAGSGGPATEALTGASAETPAAPTAARSALTHAALEDAGAAEVVWTRFVFTSDDAKRVAVAGDFSRWDPVPLTPRTVDGQTIWTGLVPVPRGEHEYQFVINGERWVTDPLAPIQRDDGFGAKNAVLKL